MSTEPETAASETSDTAADSHIGLVDGQDDQSLSQRESLDAASALNANFEFQAHQEQLERELQEKKAAEAQAKQQAAEQQTQALRAQVVAETNPAVAAASAKAEAKIAPSEALYSVIPETSGINQIAGLHDLRVYIARHPGDYLHLALIGLIDYALGLEAKLEELPKVTTQVPAAA